MTLSLELVTDLASFETEWASLAAVAAPSNPFTSPGWLIPWAEQFVDARDLRVLAIRDGGDLRAVAPFYLARHGLRRAGSYVELQLLGAGRAPALTELPQVVIRSGDERRVLRFLIHELTYGDIEFDWLHISLPQSQGWIEQEWVERQGSCAIILQKGTRAAVVVEDLSADALRANASRNLREALRKSRARLSRDGHDWAIAAVETATDLDEAVDWFLGLHAARADITDRKRHPNHFASVERRQFLRSAANRLVGRGELCIYTLTIDGRPAAAQIVLRAPTSVYLYLSGLSSFSWPYGAGVLLQFECLRDAGERGFRAANLSIGPDAAKLRWGGVLSLFNEFVVVRPRRLSRAAFSIYWPARAAGLLMRESRRLSAR